MSYNSGKKPTIASKVAGATRRTLTQAGKKVTNAVGTGLAARKIISSKRAIKQVGKDVAAFKKARGYAGASNQVPGAVEARTNAAFAAMNTKRRNAKWSK